ncbi:hypothetical protein DIPPA_21348 [Diplonema papillatum]|nr:hypothetical protein DIPPA_21348 [Diplonema papillatum]
MAHLHDAAPPAERLTVFYLLHAPDKMKVAAVIAGQHAGREEKIYRKLEEKYAAWRFFEVWAAVDSFYRAYAPGKLPMVSKLIRDWHPRGLEGLLLELEHKYSSSYFTDRGLIPLNDASHYRAAVEALYRRYDPCRVSCVGTLLGAYRGFEADLLQLLKYKFEGAQPSPLLDSVPATAHAPALVYATDALYAGQTQAARPRAGWQKSSTRSGSPAGSLDMTPEKPGRDHDRQRVAWAADPGGDYAALLAAMERKDQLIAQQTAALQQAAPAARAEDPGRRGSSAAPVAAAAAQPDAITQLYNEIIALRQSPNAADRHPPLSQRRHGHTPSSQPRFAFPDPLTESQLVAEQVAHQVRPSVFCIQMAPPKKHNMMYSNSPLSLSLSLLFSIMSQSFYYLVNCT